MLDNTTRKKYLPQWRILEMEHWDKDCIDLVVPGYIYFDKDGLIDVIQYGLALHSKERRNLQGKGILLSAINNLQLKKKNEGQK